MKRFSNLLGSLRKRSDAANGPEDFDDYAEVAPDASKNRSVVRMNFDAYAHDSSQDGKSDGLVAVVNGELKARGMAVEAYGFKKFSMASSSQMLLLHAKVPDQLDAAELVAAESAIRQALKHKLGLHVVSLFWRFSCDASVAASAAKARQAKSAPTPQAEAEAKPAAPGMPPPPEADFEDTHLELNPEHPDLAR